MSKDIFLDNHSTTPLDPRVLAEMLPIFTEDFGNPSSRFHRFGWRAEAHVEKARTSVTDLIGALHEREIVFTSGATESNNLAIKGVLERTDFPGRLRIITSAIEH
ncbi:MAG: aminotransferase class V-fold PLP-dependent enzyme, partial [Bdellovibrionota bacterium]